MEPLFWSSLLIILYANAGYPMLLLALKTIFARRPSRNPPATKWPSLSVVLVVRNEETRIAGRLSNLLACAYPGGIEVIVVCDGCTDATAAAASAFGGKVVRVIECERQGKAACLNTGVAQAGNALIVFADARQNFDADALAQLAGCFADPSVGAVSGSLDIQHSASGTGRGVDAYWRLEKFIRSAESEIDSCIGCTGAIYAVRKSLYEPLPPDTILDDVVVPMQIATRGSRVLFEASAKAYDPQPLEPAREWKRKTRTMAGNFQMLFRHPHWLLPTRNRLWWQLVSHKYLRLLVPLLLLCCLGTSAGLARVHWIYAATFLGQIVLYLAAGAGFLLPRTRWRILNTISGFVFLQFLCVAGFVRYLRLRFAGSPGGW
jgi:cellulose synthase/poly-beta-1,6-N-acetylglucosamine synthase-like glycosyltransferase